MGISPLNIFHKLSGECHSVQIPFPLLHSSYSRRLDVKEKLNIISDCFLYLTLFQKLDKIKQALGSDKVFDVIGEVLGDKNLSQLMVEAAANARRIDEILKELDITVDEEYIAKVKDNMAESLATRYIDYTRIKEMAQQAKEHRLIPEYTEEFFKRAVSIQRHKVSYETLIFGTEGRGFEFYLSLHKAGWLYLVNLVCCPIPKNVRVGISTKWAVKVEYHR